MVFGLTVNFLTVTDRLIDEMTIELVDPAHPPKALSGVRAGQRRLLVDWLSSGEQFILNVKIPNLPGRGNMLAIAQTFQVVELAAGGVAVTAIAPLHTRLFVAAIASGSTEVTIQLDLTFLDVSPRRWNKLRHENYQELTSMALELVGQRPTVWMVLIPSSIQSSETEAEILLFLRPEVSSPYKNGDEITPFEFFARFADQPPRPNDVASYLQTHSGPGRSYSPYRGMSWGLQLFQAKRKSILVFPIPHTDKEGVRGMDYGVLNDPSKLDETLKLLRRALVHEKKLSPAAGSTVPILKRLAIGGFSLGGDHALEVWEANQTLIQEVYLFDPGQGIPQSGALLSWLNGDPGRKLELICPAFSSQAAEALASRLPGRINARATNSAYFSRDLAYLMALNSEFTMPGSRSAGRATIVSNIVMDSDSPPPNQTITLRGAGTADGKSVTRTIAGVTPSEAAVFVEGVLAPRFLAPLADSTVMDVAKVLDGITNNDPGRQQPRQLDHRHSWAVMGGERLPGSTFRGFLQICLEESGFTPA